MKTSNLIITFGLCSLIFSPASIFGMETRKRRNKKERNYADVTKKGIRVTQKNHTIEIDSEPKYQLGTDEESTTIDTVIITPFSTNDSSNVEEGPSYMNRVLTWCKDACWNEKVNILAELTNDTFDSNNTSNLRRLEKALEQCCKEDDPITLINIISLCNSKEIDIDNRVLMTRIHKFLLSQKTQKEKELAKVVNKHHNDIAQQLNEKLKQLKEVVGPRAKEIEDLKSQLTNSSDNYIKKCIEYIKKIKAGQIVAHCVNTSFTVNDYCSDEEVIPDDYTEEYILQKPTVKKFDQRLQLRKDTSEMLYHLTQVKELLHNIRGIKAITEQ